MEDSVVRGTMQNNMPELPEVETIKRILDNNLLHRKISKIEILKEKTIEGNAKEFKNSVEGKTIDNITRNGKFLVFHLSEKVVFLSHLRMEGKYYFFQNQNATSKYQRVRFYFEDGTLLIYDDSRQFGIMILKNEDNYLTTPPLSNLGKEPFDVKSVDNLYKIFLKTHKPVKTLILDQSVIAGLGNIYADEVLFLSKIHPETPANALSKDDVQNIINNSVIVLNKAIQAGGSTIKTYHPANGVDGNFQSKLNVYDKPGKPCPVCHTPLVKITVGGRGSTFCPHCQKNRTLPYLLGVTGPIGSGKSTITNYLKNDNFQIINADQIVHNLYDDENVKNNVAKLLHVQLTDDGKLDNTKIKETLLNDSKLKIKLEHYIHPLVKDIIINEIKKHSPHDKIAIEVPLLFEAGYDYLFDDILYVDIDKAKEKELLRARNSNVQESLLLNKNFNRDDDKRKATIVINNNGDIKDLYKQLDHCLIKMRR
jgi:formamidopyrimidine-DNA glycosylase